MEIDLVPLLQEGFEDLVGSGHPVQQLLGGLEPPEELLDRVARADEVLEPFLQERD